MGIRWLFTWEGRVTRREYLVTGLSLLLVKYVLDVSIAGYFGVSWSAWNYLTPSVEFSPFMLEMKNARLAAALWLAALPFFLIAVSMTLRRLRDAGRSAMCLFLLFIPVVHAAMFLALSLAATRELEDEQVPPAGGDVRREAPRALLAAILIVAAGFFLTWISTGELEFYGLGLFIGIPFVSGFATSWFFNWKLIHTQPTTFLMSALSPFALGMLMLGFGLEGLFCLLMALPLSLPFSLAGGYLARVILMRRRGGAGAAPAAASFALLPLVIFGEYSLRTEPPEQSVSTRVTIHAPASTVWQSVIAFPPLDEPEEWYFRHGIAYPKSAEMIGRGVGAVRYCRFSTGDFVEPITVWDENRLLAFDVTAQPDSMRELSPWDIRPPHVEKDYLQSLRGQFRLVALSDHETLLEGTTWYQNHLWPQAYWRLWSDAIVQRIHGRVLEHVKLHAERAAAGGETAPDERAGLTGR